MRIKKENKGITLVALVITVVVLIILTGITVQTFFGDSGIITKSKKIAQNETLAQQEGNEVLSGLNVQNDINSGTKDISDTQKASLTIDIKDVTPNSFKVVAHVTDEISGISSIQYSIDNGKTYLENPGSSTSPTYTFTNLESNTAYVVKVKVTKAVKNATSSLNTTEVKTIGSTIAPKTQPTIPQGYSYVEGTVDTGYVIQDTSANQWVWIPVNSEILDVTNCSTDDEINASMGIAVNNKVYPMAIKLSTGNYAGMLYYFLDTGQSEKEYKTNGKVSREPAYLTDTTTGDASSYNTIGITQELMQNTFNDMINSVKNYGGFYVGRYELTGTVDNPTEKAGVTLTNQNWYNLYKACKAVKSTSNVQTSMIWGCQWDAVCSYIANSGDKKNIVDSSSWGNYGTGSVIETGSNQNYKSNNIYDIAGNCGEWTQEACYTNDRAYRGSHSFSYSGSDSPASYRQISGPAFAEIYCSSRAVFYIK